MESAGTPPLTVLVAHKDGSHRALICAGLEAAGLHVVAQASAGDEALELALETRPAVCLLSLQLVGQTGLSVAAVVARVLDQTGGILMPAAWTVGAARYSVRVAAAGSISGNLDPARLAAAVSAVAAGEASFPRRQLRLALDFLVPQVA